MRFKASNLQIALACIEVAALLLNREKDLKNWLVEMNLDVEKAGNILSFFNLQL